MNLVLPGTLAMAAIVVASNVLVQIPLGGYLTWGALTYPFAFLVTDLTNRLSGPAAARRVVLAGFVVGILCSFVGTRITGEFGPLVDVHPGSGRKLLFVGVHARQIVGWPTAEGRMLLLDLLEHATVREHVYAHDWSVGDTVMWDNRSTLHRGRRFDIAERRELRRTTINDTPEAKLQAA